MDKLMLLLDVIDLKEEKNLSNEDMTNIFLATADKQTLTDVIELMKEY